MPRRYSSACGDFLRDGILDRWFVIRVNQTCDWLSHLHSAFNIPKQTLPDFLIGAHLSCAPFLGCAAS